MKIFGESKHFGSVDLQGHELQNMTLEDAENYPSDPKVGSFIFLQKRVMVCVGLDGSPTWVPLTQEFTTYIHHQSEAEAVWTISHDMNNTGVMVQCFDSDNKVVIPSEIESTDNNMVTVTFPTPVAGKAIVLLGSFDGTPKPNTAYEDTFTNQTVVNVPHMLGYNPIIRVIVDGFEIQPESVQHVDNNNAIVEFSNLTTGRIIAI